MYTVLTITIIAFLVSLGFSTASYIDTRKRSRTINVGISQHCKWTFAWFWKTMMVPAVVGTLILLIVWLISLIIWSGHTSAIENTVVEQQRDLYSMGYIPAQDTNMKDLFIKITKEQDAYHNDIFTFEFNSGTSESGKRLERISQKIGSGKKDDKGNAESSDKRELFYHDDLPADAKPYMLISKKQTCSKSSGYSSNFFFSHEQEDEYKCTVASPTYEEWHFFVPKGTVLNASGGS